MKIRIRAERDHGHLLLRMWWRWIECAYVSFRLRGLQAEIEFPSEWHEHRMGWVSLSLGFVTLAFGFPWKWLAPDHGQCQGPTYGFAFHGQKLWIYFGQDTGRSRDPRKYWAISTPWEWRHREHEVLTAEEQHPYRYILRSGEVQDRIATIKAERRLWTRPWLPRRMERPSIDVSFNDEVGEQTGSWKGGVMGCGYHMLPGETPLDTLRRMERERKFS